MPGVAEHSRALVTSPPRRGQKSKSSSHTPRPTCAARRRRLKIMRAAAGRPRRRAGRPLRLTLARGFDAPARLRLKAEGAEVVFPRSTGGFALIEAASAGWPPTFPLGVFAGATTGAVTRASGQNFSVLPPRPVRRDARWQGRVPRAPRDISSRRATCLAAGGLRRRESLRRGAQARGPRAYARESSMRSKVLRFRDGIDAAPHFGRTSAWEPGPRRHVDPDKKEFAPVGKWVKAL